MDVQEQLAQLRRQIARIDRKWIDCKYKAREYTAATPAPPSAPLRPERPARYFVEEVQSRDEEEGP